MRLFDEKAYVESICSVFEDIPVIENIVSKISDSGFNKIFMIGVGGSLAFHLQMESIVKAHSKIDARALNATEVFTTGCPQIQEGTLAVFHSRSGDTQDLMDAASYARNHGAKVVLFAEKTESPLAGLADYVIPGVGYYYLIIFYTCLMHSIGDFPEYSDFITNLKEFPKIFAKDISKIDPDLDKIGEKYSEAPFIYVVGAGNLWGWAYSFAMCVMEETMWMHTKSVHAGEFFHGTIEVITRDSYMLLLRGEDASRRLVDRVENFSSRVCRNVTVLDTKECPLEGIKVEYRDILSPIVMEFMCRRIQLSFEFYLRHPKEIRRYYRCLSY